METAIRIENVYKHFGRRKKKRVQAVSNLSLEVPSGKVFGFLGPNGAGKSTTIRMILDLITPTQGDVYVFGKHVRKERNVLNRVGSLVEGATFYNFLTGRKNLEVFALTSNMPITNGRIDEVLEMVDMREPANRKAKGYSTGMKQRLGLAAALLTDPELIILDEPANGLDPQGITEIRKFIRQLVDEHGKTVFLSSHQLGEVEQTCDEVAIINKGQLIQQGVVSELVSGKSQFKVTAKPITRAKTIADKRWKAEELDEKSMVVDIDDKDVPKLIEILVKEAIEVFEVTRHRKSLEEYFLSVTNGTHDVA